jgi:hypothetical protein
MARPLQRHQHHRRHPRHAHDTRHQRHRHHPCHAHDTRHQRHRFIGTTRITSTTTFSAKGVSK